MTESIVVIFKTLATAAKTLEAFKALLRGKKGDTRALLEEIKGNARLCWLVIERDTAPLKIVPELATTEYDRILRTAFRFNSIKRKKVQSFKELEESELSSFIGKETADLIENIYDKIKALKQIYRVDRNNPKIRWRRRVISLQKRILLLMKHLKS